MNQGLRIAYASNGTFAHWIKAHSYLAESSFHILQGWMWVAVTYLFAGALPLRSFVHEIGFAKRVTLTGWFFAWGAVGFALLNLLFVQKGWSMQDPSAKSFFYAGQLIWLNYLAQSTLLSPFIEEAVMRGFVYRAFRGSFGVIPSTALILCFQTYFHWGLVSHDLIALAFMIAFGAVLCVIRERTGNTWDCVAFHAVYNATVFRQWWLTAIAIVFLLLLCNRSVRPNLVSATGGPSNNDKATGQ